MKEVTAAIIFKNNKILIAKRSDDDLKDMWEFPGGKIELGESPEECLIREIREELDIKIAIKKYIGESVYNYDKGSIKLLGYISEYTGGDLMVNVHKEIKWINKSDLINYKFAPADIPFVKLLIENKV